VPAGYNKSSDSLLMPYIIVTGKIAKFLKPVITLLGGKNITQRPTIITEWEFEVSRKLVFTFRSASISDPYDESSLTYSQQGIGLSYYSRGYVLGPFLNRIGKGTFFRLEAVTSYINQEDGFSSSLKKGQNVVLRAYLTSVFFYYGLFFVSDTTFKHLGGGIFAKMSNFEFELAYNNIDRYRIMARQYRGFSLSFSFKT